MERNKLLNVQQLIKEVDSVNEIEPKILSHGLKPKFPENTPEEADSIKSIQDDLRKLISTERVARNSERSQATLCSDGSIKIDRKTGKWNLYGKLNYLEPHEALYLIEMNKLEVYHNSVIVSLEKAYCMFLKGSSELTTSDKLSKQEYLIYSQFMRFGCGILKHAPETDDGIETAEQTTSSPVVDEHEQKSNQESNLYAWQYLFELLDLKKPLPVETAFDKSKYEKVKSSMDNIMSGIKDLSKLDTTHQNEGENCSEQSGSQNSDASHSIKRKPSDQLENIIPEKRFTLESTSEAMQRYGNYALNAFMVGPEFKLFQQIFNKIDVIKLNLDDENDINCDQLKFSFDLFALDPSFSRTKCEQPCYRLIILRTHAARLPSCRQIIQLYKSQKFKSTIILVDVNEDLSFHAYIYRFTVE